MESARRSAEQGGQAVSALPQGLTGRASIDGDYRYDLLRDWHTPMEIDARTYSGVLSVDFVLWIMLNPSTPDAAQVHRVHAAHGLQASRVGQPVCASLH